MAPDGGTADENHTGGEPGGRVRVGVIGVGHLGKHHARLLAGMDDAELVAVADPREAARDEAAEKFGCRAFADFQELDGLVDAVSVVVPTRLHAPVAEFFLERGVDVLVEKPIAPTAEEGRRMCAAAERHGRILQVGHIERFNPAFGALQERGVEPRYVETQRLAPFTFRSTDIGVVLDLMIHDLDLLLALVDSEVVDVEAFGGAVFTPAEDMASATLKFANGAVAHLTASRVALKPMRRMRVFSRDAYASIDFTDRQGVLIRKAPGWDLEKLDVDQVDTSQIDDLWKYVFDGLLTVDRYSADERNPLHDELAAFVRSVRTREAPVVTGEDGVRAVEVAHRVLESIRKHPW